MPLEILLHPRAASALEKLDQHTRLRIKKAILELKDDLTQGTQLKSSDFWKTRVGDYRIIYEVHDDEETVVVLFIGHRKHVYDDFSKLI